MTTFNHLYQRYNVSALSLLLINNIRPNIDGPVNYDDVVDSVRASKIINTVSFYQIIPGYHCSKYNSDIVSESLCDDISQLLNRLIVQKQYLTNLYIYHKDFKFPYFFVIKHNIHNIESDMDESYFRIMFPFTRNMIDPNTLNPPIFFGSICMCTIDDTKCLPISTNAYHRYVSYLRNYIVSNEQTLYSQSQISDCVYHEYNILDNIFDGNENLSDDDKNRYNKGLSSYMVVNKSFNSLNLDTNYRIISHEHIISIKIESLRLILVFADFNYDKSNTDVYPPDYVLIDVRDTHFRFDLYQFIIATNNKQLWFRKINRIEDNKFIIDE